MVHLWEVTFHNLFFFFFQVDSKDSSRNSVDSEFAAEAESQNDTMEKSNKVQKRKRDRPQDQGSTMIYLKAIQGILGTSMPKRKGEAAARSKAKAAERPSRPEGPATSITVSAPQKEKESTPEGRVEEEKAEEKSGFCNRRVVIDPQEKPEEEPLGDRRMVIDKRSPPLKFVDDSDSHLNSQKVSQPHARHGLLVLLNAFGLFSLILSVTHLTQYFTYPWLWEAAQVFFQHTFQSY